MDPRETDESIKYYGVNIFVISILIAFVLFVWWFIGTIYHLIKYSYADAGWAARAQIKVMLETPGKIWNFSLADFFIWMVNWPFIIWLIVIIIVLRLIFKD